MKRYYNQEENKVYYEGRSLTFMLDGVLHSGIPTEEQLERLGYVLREQPKPKKLTDEEKERQAMLQRMSEIQSELQRMDYLTDKEADGEDMSKYDEQYGGDWHGYRRKLRVEYNELELRV